MAAPEIAELLPLVEGWDAVRNHHLVKTYTFKNFAEALAFVDRIGAMAEEQWHHPDVHLGWGKVTVEIWTHKIDGLTESDFVFAAKCDVLRGGN
jgi:4a-hydroxytetrahydrobiopterin dehydratase